GAVGRPGHPHRRGRRTRPAAPPRPRARRRHRSGRLPRRGGGAARGAPRHPPLGRVRPRRPPCAGGGGGPAARRRARSGDGALVTGEARVVHTVVKVGGGLLSKAGAFDPVTEALTAFSPRRRLVIVPGGGPFADAVRTMFRRIKIGDDAAHWMAVLGMDQYAHVLAARLPEAALVDGDGGIAAALQANRLPVLAPYRWLRAADPLPHSWEVTSDSIAAWLAGQLRARRVVLIKPAHALDAKTIVDSYFLRTLPHGVEHLIVTADDLGQLDVALREDPPPDRDSKGGRRAG